MQLLQDQFVRFDVRKRCSRFGRFIFRIVIQRRIHNKAIKAEIRRRLCIDLCVGIITQSAAVGMHHRAHGNPIRHRICRAHHIRGERAFTEQFFRNTAQIAFCTVGRRGHGDQLLARACQSDIEDTQLLAELAALDLQRQSLIRHGVIADAVRRVAALLDIAVLRMQQHLFRRIADKAVIQIGEDHNRELQSFARMHTHHGDSVVAGIVLGRGGLEIGLVFDKAVEIVDKRRQAFMGIHFKALRVIKEHAQIVSGGGHVIKRADDRHK